jgi:hypothetical protein
VALGGPLTVLAAKDEIALASEEHLAVSRPLKLPRPAAWSVAAPWALLDEVVLNLEWVEEMHFEARPGRAARLTLKTSPGVAFRLELSPPEALPIAEEVRDRSSFTWDKLEIVELPLPTAIAYPRSLRPEVVSLASLLHKHKL